MQFGGIKRINGYEDKPSHEAYEYFYENSTLSLVTYDTKGGILLKLNYTGRDPPPYILTRSNYQNQYVTEIILKLVFSYIDDYERPRDMVMPNGNTIQFQGEKEFINEVKTQEDIFTRSLDDYLEPICPSIIFFQRITNDVTLSDENFILEYITELINKTQDPRLREALLNINQKYNLEQNIINQHINKRIREENARKNQDGKLEDEVTAPISLDMIAMEMITDTIKLPSRGPPNISDYLALYELFRLYKFNYEFITYFCSIFYFL